MAAKIARVTDTGHGVCNNHSSPTSFTCTFTNGSPTAKDRGLAVMRVGDTGTTSCGHHVRATTGSGVCMSDGLAIHRVGDVGVVIEGSSGTYVVDTGSPTSDCL